MSDDSRAFLTRAFLRRVWSVEFEAWRGSVEDRQLLERLRNWAARSDLRERSSEGAFVQTFFVDTWGYQLTGRSAESAFTAWPGYAVEGAGAGGSTGEADLALGWFGEGPAVTPQVLCEFKDIRSDLDAPQRRKGNTRSPVRQCFDYLAGARRRLMPNEPILPWWGVVSDMNEFRLYWWDRSETSYLRFVIDSRLLPFETVLVEETDAASFERFLFSRLFARDRLLSRGGRPPLARLVDRQGASQKELEGEFWTDYKAVRDRLFDVLVVTNPGYRETPGRLLRLAQKILDRFIFAFYCEDMGERMLFPPSHIRDFLIQRSNERFYDPNGDELWSHFRRLFQVMDTGGRIGAIELREFNGGLFHADPEIDALSLPNHVFCAPAQGRNEASIRAEPNTLLHLCASYNYAARGEARESISLYTLGRIFEQSITELEIKEARLEGRLSVAEASKRKLPKRKRDGVYYTPEWVVGQVVEGALGAWLAEQRAAVGWTGDEPADPDQLDAFEARLRAVRVLDPACGSGAFLIGAFRRLLAEHRSLHALRQARNGGAPVAFHEAAVTRAILDCNIFGVDINPAAVEIAKLALWLHSARADAPLSSLDGALRDGNSLVGPDYFKWTQVAAFTEAAREHINAFDWSGTFPEAFADGGFDVVVGNPPYVKLQNLRQVDADQADYLLAAREGDFYASTQTGNFDLYLPFIEKGLRLLRPGGQMGYIAPSIWTVAEYGAGLRILVRAGRHLRRWIDFRSHQIFSEATTYTALQFFSAAPNAAVEVAFAPGGEAEVAGIDWGDPDRALTYDRLPHGEPWLMATGEDRALIDRLAETCLRLDDPAVTSHIFQGLITSADAIYHLQRIGPGRYRCHPKDAEPYEVEIEDQIMRPLVSGAEAKRYESPRTDTWLLFPYAPDTTGRMSLIGEPTIVRKFPKAWTYLKSWEAKLRGREDSRMNRPDWYGYVYPKNLGLQDLPKLIVPRIVTHLKSALDHHGRFYLDNVDVGGVIAADEADGAFLNGVLNGPVADFVFRRLSKPFANDYFSANRQFIAPLPAPRASAEDRADIGARAVSLQRMTTARRDLVGEIEARIAVLPRARHDARWLWPRLPEAPAEEAVEAREAELQGELDREAPLEAVFAGGELRLLSGGTPVIRDVFLDDAEGALTCAWWRWLCASARPVDARKFTEALRRPPTGAAAAAARQFIARVGEFERSVAAIDSEESAMNERLFDLYGLSEDERRLIRRG